VLERCERFRGILSPLQRQFSCIQDPLLKFNAKRSPLLQKTWFCANWWSVTALVQHNGITSHHHPELVIITALSNSSCDTKVCTTDHNRQKAQISLEWPKSTMANARHKKRSRDLPPPNYMVLLLRALRVNFIGFLKDLAQNLQKRSACDLMNQPEQQRHTHIIAMACTDWSTHRHITGRPWMTPKSCVLARSKSNVVWGALEPNQVTVHYNAMCRCLVIPIPTRHLGVPPQRSKCWRSSSVCRSSSDG